MQYFFSIVIPVYNTEQYLKQCFSSILDQSFPSDRVEVVLVNDASPKTAECDFIVSSYKDKLNIVYVKFEENKSSHMARKTGVENANGRYVLFVDPDDYFEKSALQTLYENVQQYGDADYIEYNFYIQRQDHRYIFKPTLRDYIGEHTSYFWHLDKDYVVWNKCYSCAFLKPLWQDMPGFYAIYNEDYYQAKFTSLYAKNTRILNMPLYVHVYDIGITAIKKFDRERLRKMIISVRNSNRAFKELYVKAGYADYVGFIHNHSLALYKYIIERSSFKDFFETASGELDIKELEEATVSYVDILEDRLLVVKRIIKLLSPLKPILRPLYHAYKKVLKNRK